MAAEFFQAKIRNDIVTIGHSVMCIAGTNGSPDFAYSVGLLDRLGYEIIVVGPPQMIAGAAVNFYAYKAEFEGKHVEPYLESFFEDAPAPVTSVEADPEKHEPYTVQCHNYYQRHVPFRQIVFPDQQGKFFWDAEYDHFKMDKWQPILSKLPKEPV